MADNRYGLDPFFNPPERVLHPRVRVASRVDRAPCASFTSDSPVAEVAQSSEIAISRCDCAIGVARFEVLDSIGAFEGFRRKVTEFRRQHFELTDDRHATLERLNIDVPLSIELQKGREVWLCEPDERTAAIPVWMTDRVACAALSVGPVLVAVTT